MLMVKNSLNASLSFYIWHLNNCIIIFQVPDYACTTKSPGPEFSSSFEDGFYLGIMASYCPVKGPCTHYSGAVFLWPNSSVSKCIFVLPGFRSYYMLCLTLRDCFIVRVLSANLQEDIEYILKLDEVLAFELKWLSSWFHLMESGAPWTINPLSILQLLLYKCSSIDSLTMWFGWFCQVCFSFPNYVFT